MTSYVEYLPLDHGEIDESKNTYETAKALITEKLSSKITNVGYIRTLLAALESHKIKLVSLLPYSEDAFGLCSLFNAKSGFTNKKKPISVTKLYYIIFVVMNKLNIPIKKKDTIIRRLFRSVYFFNDVLEHFYNIMNGGGDDEDKTVLEFFLRDPESFAKEWSTEQHEDVQVIELNFFKQWSHSKDSYKRQEFSPFGLAMTVGGEGLRLYDEIFSYALEEGEIQDKDRVTTKIKDWAKSIANMIITRFPTKLDETTKLDENDKEAIYRIILSTLRLRKINNGEYDCKISYNIAHMILISIILGRELTVIRDTACNGGCVGETLCRPMNIYQQSQGEDAGMPTAVAQLPQELEGYVEDDVEYKYTESQQGQDTVVDASQLEAAQDDPQDPFDVARSIYNKIIATLIDIKYRPEIPVGPKFITELETAVDTLTVIIKTSLVPELKFRFDANFHPDPATQMQPQQQRQTLQELLREYQKSATAPAPATTPPAHHRAAAYFPPAAAAPPPPTLVKRQFSNPDGRDGTDGADGADGTDGTYGTDGADGTHGADGTYGTDGTHGADGTDGPKKKSAKKGGSKKKSTKSSKKRSKTTKRRKTKRKHITRKNKKTKRQHN